jgi:hypothetical protein
MGESGPQGIASVLDAWLTVERQAPIVLGVLLLLGLWVGNVVEPFALGIPSYAIYFLVSGLGQHLGLVGIEGSRTIFWASAVLWLYVCCTVLLAVSIAVARTFGESA